MCVSLLICSDLNQKFLKILFVYFHLFERGKEREGKEEREREGGRDIFHLLVHSLQMPVTAGDRPGRSQEPGPVSRCPMWVAGTQVLQPSPASSQGVC